MDFKSNVKVNVLGKGSLTAAYIGKGGNSEYLKLEHGVNILQGSEWDAIKDTAGVRMWLENDSMTFSQIAKDVPVEAPKEKPDLVKAERFVGAEDGKDSLDRYARKFGIILKKNMNVANMFKDFKKQIEG